MKNILTILLLFSASVTCIAQHDATGTWLGTLSAGREVRLVFNVRSEGGKFTATMDSPDQGVKDIACSDVRVTSDSLIISLSDFKSSYAGKFNPNNTISGRWMQNGVSFMLNLTKVDKVEGAVRRQTPVAPFAYKSEDVIYHNADKSIQYGATITIPNGKGPFTAIIMSTGSGQQNRDEELMGHKPFAVIADYLTKRGYVVLRVDDQGIGKTTGNPTEATTADFAKDVMSGIAYLKTRKEVDKMKIGIMGHSEGGIIAPMVASQSKDVAFIVMLAGAGISNLELMEEQNAALYRKYGIKEEAIEAYLPLYNELATIIINAPNKQEATKMITAAVDNWRSKVTPQAAFATTGITDDASKEKFINEFAGLYDAPWWRYFMGINAQDYLMKLSCKVLALNGEKDIQVVAKSNLAGIKESLAKSKSVKYDVKELPGLNHLFQKCNTCSPNEYGELEETFSTDALAIIGDWLDEHIK